MTIVDSNTTTTLRKLCPEPQDSQALRYWFEASVFGWTPARQDARGALLVKLSPTDNATE